MKKALVNGRWQIWLPDGIADWDAITGDPVARRGWEYCRFESIQKHHHFGDIFYDVGVEHGWITAVLAREFVGASSIFLIEPSPEFWVNIRKIWKWNNFDEPAGFWPGFISDTSSGQLPSSTWPSTADATLPEIPGMAYGSLNNPKDIPSITIDKLVKDSGVVPASINMDIEGAEFLALQGAVKTLTNPKLTNIWVSIHPDLLEGFGHSKQELLDFMLKNNWSGAHLGTDHEEHWHFIRTK